MKQPVTLEADLIESGTIPQRMGIAFNHGNTVKAVSVEAGAAIGADTKNQRGNFREALANYIKPAASNLFLLGCLLGLFVLYCCSCVIHALKFPARRKSS